MRTFLTDENNDFVLGANGNLAIARDIEAIAQESRHHAATLRGEMIHSMDQGIAYFRDVFNKIPNLAQVEASLRRRILSIDDVVSITFLRAFISGETLKYEATIKTVYGEVSINGDV